MDLLKEFQTILGTALGNQIQVFPGGGQAWGEANCKMIRQYKLWIFQLKEDQAMPEIYIYAVEGRTMDQKRSLVRDVTDAVVRHFQVTPADVMVQIMETPKTSKAKGGILFSDRPDAQAAAIGPMGDA